MNCMKCGREITTNEAFCDSCREAMKTHPVRPDSVVQIPRQPEGRPGRKVVQHRWQVLTAEEQVRRLKRRNRTLILLTILAISISVFLGIVVYRMGELFDFQSTWGQNYHIVESTDPTEPSEAP